MTYNDLCLELLKEKNQNKEIITIRCKKEIGISKKEKIIFKDYKDIHIIKSFNEIYVVIENVSLRPLKLDISLYNKLSNTIYGDNK